MRSGTRREIGSEFRFVRAERPHPEPAFRANGALRELATWLASEAPALISVALQCIHESRNWADYKSAGEMVIEDLPEVNGETVDAYNEKMRQVYDLVRRYPDYSGVIRGFCFEHIVAAVLKASVPHEGYRTHMDSWVFVDGERVVVRDEWESRHDASSIDVVRWDHAEGPIDAGAFITCKVSAHEVATVDVAYLYVLRDKASKHAVILIAAAGRRSRRTVNVVRSILQRLGIEQEGLPQPYWVGRQVLQRIAEADKWPAPMPGSPVPLVPLVTW